MTELLKFDQISYNEPILWLEEQWGRKLEPHEKNIVILIYRYTRTSQEAEEIKILDHGRCGKAIQEFEKEYAFEHSCQVENAKDRSRWHKGALRGFEHIKEIFDKHFKHVSKPVNNVDKSCVLCQDAAERVDLKGQLFCNQCFEDVYL